MVLQNFIKQRLISIDLGTANTLIWCDNQLVLDEPSVVALE